METFINYIKKISQDKFLILVICFIMITIIGFIDIHTTSYIRLSLFYIFPILVSSLVLGVYVSFGFSLYAAVCYTLPDLLEHHFTFWLIWNVIMRLSIYLTIAILANYYKKAQDKLNIELENAKKLREEALQSKLEAENAYKNEEQFLANMSHEIRTPMNAIIGMTALIKNSNLNPKQEKYIKDIEISAQHLLVIINEILDLSKVKSGKMELDIQTFSLKPILANLESLFVQKTNNKQLRFVSNIQKDIPEFLKGDAHKLSQVLINVIGNAVKFTNKGNVNLEVKVTKETNDKVVLKFEISDSGIGMTPEQINSIFDSYKQASKETSRIYGGTGLGLSITKKIIELMDGSIEVKSEIGVGTTFTITIPFTLSTREKMKLPEIDFVKFQNEFPVKLLIVEDNEFNQIVAKDTLEALFSQIDIVILDNAFSALNMLNNTEFDMIIMDVQMPEIDGFEATRRIRSSGKVYANIPILAMTASSTEEEKNKCFEAGMNDFVSKPFEINELKSKIINMLMLCEKENKNEIFSSSISINYDFVESLSKNKQDVQINYLNIIAGGLEKELENLKKGCRENDFETIFRAAHNMRPSLNYLGISDIETSIKEIENLSNLHEQLSVINPKVNVLVPHIEKIRMEINKKIIKLSHNLNI